MTSPRAWRCCNSWSVSETPCANPGQAPSPLPRHTGRKRCERECVYCWSCLGTVPAVDDDQRCSDIVIRVWLPTGGKRVLDSERRNELQKFAKRSAFPLHTCEPVTRRHPHLLLHLPRLHHRRPARHHSPLPLSSSSSPFPSPACPCGQLARPPLASLCLR